MTTKELMNAVQQLKEWEAMEKEAKANVNALKKMIQDELISKNVETLEVGPFTIRYTSMNTEKFDSTAFKKAAPEMYLKFIKHISSRRFSIS